MIHEHQETRFLIETGFLMATRTTQIGLLYLVNLLDMLANKLGYPLKLKMTSYHTAYWVAGAMELLSNTILFGREPVLTRYAVGLLAFSQTLDITAAKTELGYQPKVSIEEGLNIFSQWWKKKNYVD